MKTFAKTKAKRLLAFALVLLLCPLCGCHGSHESNEFVLPEGFDTSKQIELTFWAKNDTNKTQTDIYKKAIADFQSLYPNVTVNLRLYTDYGRIYNDVITNIPTNTTPNVCITYPDHIATYLTGSNTVVPLDGLMTHPEYGLGGSKVNFSSPTANEVIPKFLEECKLMGHYYALPYMRSTEACYVNKDMVKALGFTMPDTLSWDFMFEVGEAAMEKNADGTFKINGQNVLIPIIYKSTDNMMIQLLQQHGAGYSTKSGDIQIFNPTTKALLEEIAVHAKSGAFSTFKISSYPANFLNAGQCIFAIDSTAGSTWMGSEAPLSDISEDKLIDFETAVMTVPQYRADSPQMISQGPSLCIFNKEDPQIVLASWLLAQYLLTDDVQIAYSQTEGYVPVTSRAQNSDVYQSYLNSTAGDALHYPVKLKATKMLLDNIDNTFVTPVFSGSASLRDAAGQMIENVTKSVRRKETVDSAYMEKLFADVSALYRLDSLGKTKDSAPEDLGPLPPTAVALLCAIGLVWLCLGAYYVRGKLLERRVSQNDEA